MRSYLTALSLVLVMSGVASAQQGFRSFAPGLSPMMPLAGPEMSKDKETDAQNGGSDRIVQGKVPRIERGSGSGVKAEDTTAARIAPNAPVTVIQQPSP